MRDEITKVNNIEVSAYVKKYLYADETILAKYVGGVSGSSEIDLYATNRRLLMFGRSLWWFYLFGIIFLLIRKSYRGATDYSEISSIAQGSFHPMYLIVLGLFGGGMYIILGIAAYIMESTIFILAVSVGVGLIVIAIACLSKVKCYRIEISSIQGLNQNWYIGRARFGRKKKQLDDFISKINYRSGRLQHEEIETQVIS